MIVFQNKKRSIYLEQVIKSKFDIISLNIDKQNIDYQRIIK